MKYLKSLNYILLIAVLCFLTRVPQLISPDFRLDSDECVVALMAKHLLKGQEFPLFFYGQYYGFSLIEELFIAPFYIVMGVTTLAVKLGMLVLWTLGVIFFYKTLVCINGDKRAAFLTTLLFIATPAWALWSFKARGGYLTAHCLSSVVLYLLFDEGKNKKNITYIIIGVLLLIIFQSQPFWLVGVVPLVAYRLVKEKSFVKASLVLLPILALWYPLYIYKQGLYIFYKVPEMDLTADNLLAHVARFSDYLYQSLHGAHHFSWAAPPDFFSAIFTDIFMGAILLIAICGIAYLFRRNNPGKWLFVCSTLFLPGVFAYSLLSSIISYRYMLPVTVFTLLSMYLLFHYNKWSIVSARSYILVIAVIGAIGTAGFYKSQLLWSHTKSMDEAVKYLEKEGVGHLYVNDYLLQWDIIFLSNERIIARSFQSPGRYPAYDSLVDRGFYGSQRVAVFGNADKKFGDSFGHYDFQNTHYYISLNPTKEAMDKNRFQFYDWKFN